MVDHQAEATYQSIYLSLAALRTPPTSAHSVTSVRQSSNLPHQLYTSDLRPAPTALRYAARDLLYCSLHDGRALTEQDEMNIRTWREAPSDSFYRADILRYLTPDGGDQIMHAVALQCYQFRHDDRGRGAA